MSLLRSRLVGLLVICILSLPFARVQGQNVPHLTVSISGQILTAGFNNNVTVTVLNNYFTAIYDVDVALGIPSALNMFGDSHKHFDTIQLGQSVTIRFQVYAPTVDIGNTYQGSVTVAYKQLGDVSYTQEVHAISYAVQGWINLVLYGLQVTPSISTPGGNATISGNLLNRGNLAAYNANVTVQSPVIVPSSLSSAFLGEIDPNIPRPFSLLVVFRSNTAPGNYSIVIRASAVDSGRPASPYTADSGSVVQLRRPVPPSNQGNRAGGGIVAIILEILRYLMDIFFGSPSSFSLRYTIALPTRELGRSILRSAN